MDPVARRLSEQSWPYASQDATSLAEISRRVASAGAAKRLLTYSEVVSGIDSCLPSVLGGRPLRLGVPEWTTLHRAIVDDFLGRLCLDTYLAGEFMGSALVVATETGEPSEGYRDLMRRVGVLHGRGKDEFLEHWAAETQRAYDWYAAHA